VIKTDPERVSFRYYAPSLKQFTTTFLTTILESTGDDLRQKGAIGFINSPIQAAFYARAVSP